MNGEFIRFSVPSVGEEEIHAICETMRSPWITTGPKVKEFEQEFARYVGAEAALGVSSGTDAMLVGLASRGVGAGDEVITTTMTFVSTVHVIEQLGAKPVLVDVDEDTLNICPERVLAAVSSKTRCIMPVHLYGHPSKLDELSQIADSKGLFLLEDAAHAIPARFNGTMIGGSGSLTAFSFYATKNLTTAEGGMLVGTQECIDRARPWSLHGMSRDAFGRYEATGSWFYQVTVPGFKCNMTDLQAAIGLAQLRKLAAFQERRGEIVRRYNERFRAVPELQTPTERPGVSPAYHLYALRLNLDRLLINRDEFIEEMRIRNVGASVHFIPVHVHPYYRDKYSFEAGDFPVAHRNFMRLISLPLHPRLTDAQIDTVIEVVEDIARKHRRQ